MTLGQFKFIEFVDQHITCERVEDGEISKYVFYQLHKHSVTGRKPCRFGFPRPPLPSMMIPKPLPKDTDASTMRKAKDLFKLLKER